MKTKSLTRTKLVTSSSQGELKIIVSNASYVIEHKLTQTEIKGLLRVLASAMK